MVYNKIYETIFIKYERGGCMILSCEIITRDRFLLETGAHPKDSVIVVLKGGFCCQTHNETYKVCENEIFFFKSGDTFHREILSPITAIYIVLDTEKFVSNQKIIPSNHTRICEDISFLVSAITEGDRQAENHYVRDILYCCMCSPQKADPLVLEVTQYIETTYNKNISLETLASTFHLSKQWLILRFKKEMNITPMMYLNNFRLKKAKELLLNQEIPVGEVALACGFTTPYYFTNAFKKHFGVSPTQWRKNMIL